MITLEELVKFRKVNKMSDIDIIKAYLIDNEMEEEGIKIISDLASSKIEKMKDKYSMAETWIRVIPTDHLYKKYKLEIANKLHDLEIDFIMNNGYLSEGNLQWAKENIPKLDHPGVFFRSLIEYLEKQDIKFLNSEKYI